MPSTSDTGAAAKDTATAYVLRPVLKAKSGKKYLKDQSSDGTKLRRRSDV